MLGKWYEAAWPTVHRLCCGFIARGSAGDDVAQDAMLRLVDQIERWDSTRPYEAWQRTVVLNVCRNHLRSESRRSLHEENAGEERTMKHLPGPLETMERHEVGELVTRFLAVLAPREREAFVMVELEGLRPMDAAEVMGIQPSTVRAALTMARRRLREALGPLLQDEA